MSDPGLRKGRGQLFTDPDPDTLRAVMAAKPKGLLSKVTTIPEAVRRYVPDGAYVAVGGFGGTRIPTAVLHEIVRSGRKGLGLSGHTATHDFQILVAGECFDRCDMAYVVGLEMRGLSSAGRRYCESGKVRMTEWTNATLLWRYRAAAMGLSFIPTRSMLGTATFENSAAAEVLCPFTGSRYAALPALSPDVALIHVHRCDVYGNCQIDGNIVADTDLAAASRHVVVTCERIIPNTEVRAHPDRTVIPYYMVDAVIEVPYGSYPANMPGEYYSDERHLRDWLDAEEDEALYRAFVDRQIHQTRDFTDYLALNGGVARLLELRHDELLISRELGR